MDPMPVMSCDDHNMAIYEKSYIMLCLNKILVFCLLIFWLGNGQLLTCSSTQYFPSGGQYSRSAIGTRKTFNRLPFDCGIYYLPSYGNFSLCVNLGHQISRIGCKQVNFGWAHQYVNLVMHKITCSCVQISSIAFGYNLMQPCCF